MVTSLDSYRTMGRSGLRVSPLALGAMTFGKDWGWGSDHEDSRRIFDTYIDSGGNFIDTAVNYTEGTSERLLGEFIKGKRERVVIGTKYSVNTQAGNPNAGGSHRLNMVRSIEASLSRLGTDHIDLFYLHVWDYHTPAEEVLRGLEDLVRSGKVVYLGISDTPAWRIAHMQTLAELRGWAPLVALQVEYSLVQRTVEHELFPMAMAMGLGVNPWAPLAGGLLAGGYSKADLAHADIGKSAIEGSRKEMIASQGNLNERTIGVAELVREIAGELGVHPAQLALAWVLLNRAVVSPVIGARTLPQLQSNLNALSIEIPEGHRERLAAATEPSATFPNSFLDSPLIKSMVSGGTKIQSHF
ncbi:MAG: aldo/keto reductase [Pseudomonadota bacterium]